MGLTIDNITRVLKEHLHPVILENTLPNKTVKFFWVPVDPYAVIPATKSVLGILKMSTYLVVEKPDKTTATV